MPFWKRKKTPEEIAEQRNRDAHKAKWLQKVLSPKEFTDLMLAQATSRTYQTLLEDQEPKKERPTEMKEMMQQFIEDVKKIIDGHANASISKRDQEIENLIHQAQFAEEYRYTPYLYYYFRTLSDDERREWHHRRKKIFKAMFPFDILDDE